MSIESFSWWPSDERITDKTHGISTKMSFPYKALSRPDEIAHMVILTHKDWQLMTPVNGTRHSMPYSKIVLSFGQKLGLVFTGDGDSRDVIDADEYILPIDIAQLIADNSCLLWNTDYFDMNSGWNAS